MRQIQSDLWETDVENPFPGLTTHAYLLTRHDGNVLFYNTGHQHEIERMTDLGGVAYHLLSHQDELGDTINTIHQRFGARLGGTSGNGKSLREFVTRTSCLIAGRPSWATWR